jgi:hypothetical protein
MYTNVPEIKKIGQENKMEKLESNVISFDKFEITKHEPYRFIGKSIYIGNKGSFGCFDSLQIPWGCFDSLHGRKLHEYLWKQSDGIFKMLDELKEYATDEIHNTVLFTWGKYDGQSQLYGYTIGRFMKAGTPVTPDMDFFDIPEGYFAKGFVLEENVEKLQGTRLAKFEDMMDEVLGRDWHNEYQWAIMMAEVYPEPDKNGNSYVGLYELLNKNK